MNLEETLEDNTNINRHQTDHSIDINQTINQNNSWLRSIPRRIRKLISKSTKHLQRSKNDPTNNTEVISSTGSDGSAHSYFLFPLDDDEEEIAMKNARSQMAK